MAKQTIVWTVIPHGRVPDGADAGRLRVSIVASPRLTPESEDEQRLGAYADWRNWPRTLERLRFGLNTGAEEIELEPQLQADPALTGGGLRVLPFVLTGSDATLLAETRDALEDVLLANGMAQADTALLAQDAFGAQIEHARYFTVNDLAAMMAMQYDNQGLAGLWPLLETAMFSPQREQWWRDRARRVHGLLERTEAQHRA